MIVMMRMIMPVMMVAVRMRGLFRISATLRIERRFDACDLRSQLHHQFFQHVVAANADTIRENLCRHMTVAEMPGDAREMMRVARGDFGNRLARRDHAHDAAVFELQAVAVMQHRGFGEIEQEYGVLRAAHGDTAAVTAIMRQFDGVGFACAIPMTGRQQFGGADHYFVLTLPASGLVPAIHALLI